MCEPCSIRKRTERAVYFCRNCSEKYCEACYLTHKAHKSSRQHDIVTFDDSAKKISECEPCSYRNKSIDSTQYCKDCEEYLCEGCTSDHRSQKQNKNHTIIQINEVLNCNPCLVNGKTETAEKYCIDCEEPEPLCASCADIHITMKRTRSHKLSSDLLSLNSRQNQDKQQEPRKSEVCQPTIKATSTIGNVETSPNYISKTCEPCHHRGMDVRASHYCQDCNERYCKNCKKKHTKSKQTKDHNVVEIIGEVENCKQCMLYNVIINATHICEDCDTNLCNECSNTHSLHKTTQKHKVMPLQSNSSLCEICESIVATLYCKDCEDPDLLCGLCAEDHKSLKQNRTHKLSNDTKKCIYNRKTKTLPEKTDFRNTCTFGKPIVKKIRDEPEKPYVTEEVSKSDRINLKWEHNKDLCDEELYQITLKEAPNGKWKNFLPPKPCRSHVIVIDGLKAETSYIFKVRVINEVTGYEGPFSPESEMVKTGFSPALRIMLQSQKGATGPPDVYMLPIRENMEARNGDAQTRKFTLGSPGSNLQEKTIMIVGATGSGKSTLINQMANYVMGVTWEDPFRFTLINLETCEKTKQGNEAVSQTEWITCYTIFNDVSSRINYTINLIDTPGFGDTRGLTQDKRILYQIRQLFTEKKDKGVTVLDAVCFILKAPDARLTATQTYIFESILALFGKDIVDNICTLITFADGQRPPVLAGLEALPGKPLPFEVYFPFNNSALFADNTVKNPSNLTPFFWDMGIKSCDIFFQKILSLQTKSLLLTSEVLTKRQQLETIILNLQAKIDQGLTNINNLEDQVATFKKHAGLVDANKDFEFVSTRIEVEKKDISGKGIHTTTCLVCNLTCHKSCVFANDSDKAKCCAMSRHKGTCKVCPKRCHWNQHSNVPFIFVYTTKQITETLYSKLAQFQKASNEKITSAQLIQNIKEQIKSCQNEIQDMIQNITEHTNRLKDIALRPDPLSTVAYIELMIESEKLEKKNGYNQRIQTLQECKKRAEVGKNVEVFQKRYDNVK